VKFNSDYYDDLGDDQFYFHSGEEPIAKFMRVEGRIIAEGTEQDSIIFTRMQDEEYYHWGTIYLPEGAPQSSFKHCVFEFSAFTGFSLSEQPRAAIAMWNGSIMIENCSFIDNDTAINIKSKGEELEGIEIQDESKRNYIYPIQFSHILGYVLKRWHQIVTAVIIGFITGSLGIVWPWKKEVYKFENGKALIDVNGNKVTENFQRYFPDFSSQETWIAICYILIGLGIILLIDKYGTERKEYFDGESL
jgi:hypothetical protein